MAKQKNFLMKVVEWPAELTAALTALLLWPASWLTDWLFNLAGIDIGEQLKVLAAGIAALLAFVGHALLEKFIPVQYHNIVNAVLKWLAGVLVAYYLIV